MLHAKKITKPIIALMIGVFFILLSTQNSFGQPATTLYTNEVDGYTVQMPVDMVIDESLSGIRTTFESYDLTVDIYREETHSRTYINYSKGFMVNGVDHIYEYMRTYNINGKTAHLYQWSRPKLSKVENDKNYYATIDIVAGNYETYTLFFKSNKPFWEIGGYDYIANSFQTIEKTEAPVMEPFKSQGLKETWNDATKEFYTEYFSEESPLRFGIFETMAPDYFEDLNSIEAQMDYKFPVIVRYKHFTEYVERDLRHLLDVTKEDGRVMELTLQTQPQEESLGNMVYDILDGKYDNYLNDFAAAIAQSEHPVLFRLGNEMNGDWCAYSSYHTSRDTEIFKEFHNYVYEIFEKWGANANTIWVFNPHDRSFPNFKWNHATMYYPGDEYIDIIGLTGYNTGTYYAAEEWRTFTEIYDEFYYEYDEQYDMPMMITEFASSSVGGSKVDWVNHMFDNIRNYDKIKVAIWWDGRDLDAAGNIARPYFIDETPELVETFKERLQEFKYEGDEE